MAGINVTFVDATTFTVLDDQTEIFMAGRRVKANCGGDGYKYGTIESADYVPAVTTVVLTAASEELTSNLTTVEVGVVSVGEDSSMPTHAHDGSEGSGGAISFDDLSDAPTMSDYATDAELTAVSGSLQNQIDNIDVDISWTDVTDKPTEFTPVAHDNTYHSETFATEDYVDTAVSGATGTTDHSALDNLDYASAGHTGFQPAGDYATVSYVEEAIEEVVYTPTDITVNYGTYQSGDLDSVSSFGDGDYYHVQEVNETPGFDIVFTISGVAGFNRMSTRFWYDGSLGHTVNIDIYNYDTTSWDHLDTTNGATYNEQHWFEVSIPDDTDYIDAGVVQVRLYHISAGSAAHDIYVDYMSIVKAGFGSTGKDHGALDGLMDDDHPQYLTRTDFTTASGNIVAQIPTDYYTQDQVDTISGSLSSDIAGKKDDFSENTAFNKNFGTGAGEVCQGNDSRLSDSRTPTSHGNEAHSSTFITAAGVTYENLNGNSDVGTGASQVAAGNHNHTGTYEPANANIQSHISSTSNPHSVDETDVLPSQSGNSGKYLTTNGTATSWAEVEGGDGDGQQGVEAIDNADDEVSVTFTTTMADANYAVTATVENTTDANPAQFGIVVTAKSTTGFTVLLSGLTDSANYKLNWRVGDDVVTADANNLTISASPSADHTAYGEKMTMTVDVNAYGFGAALYIASDGHLETADADSYSTMPVFALALETGTGSKQVLTRGVIRDDTWNWTPGATVFAGVAAGGLIQTAPTGTGDVVQVVGVAMSADTIYFNPDYTLIEVL